MSADVIYLKNARGRLTVAREMHDHGEEADIDQIAQLYIRLVYCMAAWNDEGLSRGRSPTGYWISAAR
jgi:hypothetical protein